MQTTPNYNLPYAEPTDARRDFPAVVNEPATTAIDTELARIDAAVGTYGTQSGERVAAVNSSGEMTLTYPEPFLSAPIVTVCMGDGSSQAALVKIKASGRTATSCVVTLLNSSNSPLSSGTFRVAYIAHGPMR